jgi:O-antigen/teichoic acid export membrane protein
MKIPLFNRVDPDAYFDSITERSDLKRRAIQGAGAMIFTSSSSFIIQLFSTVILARLLSPTDFGLIAMVLTIHSFLQMIRNLGLLDATVQREDINHKLISTIFWINILFGIFLSLTFIAVSPIVAWFYKEPRLPLIILFMSVDYIFGGLCTQHRALLRRSLQLYRWAAIDIISSVVSFGLAIFLAWKGLGYWALVARWVLFSPTQAALAWIICPWRPGLPSKDKRVVSMLKFGVGFIGGMFVEYIMNNLDKIIIGRRLGPQMLGHYNRAYNLYQTPSGKLSSPISGVAISTLSRICNDPEQYNRYYIKAFSILALIGFPIGFIFTLTGKDIVLLFLGPQWGLAGEIFSILGFGIGLQILYDTNTWIHVSLAKNERRIRWGIFAAISTVFLYIIGFSFGVHGIAAARSISLYILIIPCLWYAGRPIGLPIGQLVRETWKFFFAALLSAVLCWYFGFRHYSISTIFGELNIILRLIILPSVYTFCYLLFIIVLHKGLEPLRQLFEVLRDIIPRRS